jgi:hypothetical protein
MPKVVFDSWLFDICLVWKVFVNIQLWHCFDYKLFVILTYGDLCSSSMNYDEP